jgi:2-polyprenyl-3-methyl-5-hydroxy-6-metoxy-1,4-benzoquinol methylase
VEVGGLKDGQKFLDGLVASAGTMAFTAQRTCAARPQDCAFLLDPLARWSEAAFGREIFSKAAKGYARYSLHVAQAQRLYEREGRYTPGTLDEIVEQVYDDPEYMVPYMWAAVLIYAFWPSMIEHLALFRDEFLGRLSVDPQILELGCGHGVLGLLAAHHRPDARVHGVDLSSAAIELAQRLHAASGIGERASFAVRDVTRLDGDSSVAYDGIIVAMLVEHVLDPKPLVAAVKRNLAPNGIVFFSTAIESPQNDHVHEFHTESEVLRLIEEAGLRARSMVSNGSRLQAKARFRPRALAAILEHA